MESLITSTSRIPREIPRSAAFVRVEAAPALCQWLKAQRNRMRGSWALWLWIAAVLLSDAVCAAAKGSAASCEVLNATKPGTEFILNRHALQTANGSVQTILDCLPEATKVLLEINEIPTEGGIFIRKPMTIQSKSGNVRLLCSEEGIEVRSSDVKLKGMKIVGCARNSAHGFVHIFPVKDVIVEDINCIANTNESGPTCISGRHSTVTLANIKATRNEGADGGALGFTNSKIFLEESTFQNNTAWGQGGAMSFSNCDLRMKSTELVDNRAEQGGAISVLFRSRENNTIYMEACNIVGNAAFEAGGGIYHESIESSHSTIQLQQCSLANNTAFLFGGAANILISRSSYSTIDLQGCKITNNSAQSASGGLYAGILESTSSTLKLQDCNIANNSVSAYSGSGGVYVEVWKSQKALIELEKCSMTNNSVADFGSGGLSAEFQASNSSAVRLSKCRITGNVAPDGAGGVFVKFAKLRNVTVELKECQISHNSVSTDLGSAGGLYIEGSDHVEIEDSYFVENVAAVGGGMFFADVKFGKIASTKILGNEAKEGGGIFIQNNKLENIEREVWDISDSTFKSNTALEGGGGICGVNGIDMTVINSEFSSNYANREGGAINLQSTARASSVSLVILSSSFKKNVAQPLSVSGQKKLRGVSNSGGGAVFIGGVGSRLNCSSSTFTQNQAGSGGAILISEDAGCQIRNTHMSRNSAILGGALASKNAKMIMLLTVAFEKNDGYRGGAVYAEGSGFQYARDIKQTKEDARKADFPFAISIFECDFTKNVAHFGGGALDILGLTLCCVDSRFSSNKVDNGLAELAHKGSDQGGGIRVRSEAVVLLKDLWIENCQAESGGGLFVDNAVMVGYGLHFHQNTAHDAGGAIAARFEPDFAIGTSDLGECHACRFEENMAGRAGIVYVALGEREASEESHRHFLFNGTVFSGNVVQSFGPMIFAANLDSAEICCEPSTFCNTGSNLLTMNLEACIAGRMEDNKLLGTFLRRWEISPNIITRYSSGEVLEDMKVSVFDAFNETVPVQATVVVTSTDGGVDLVIPPGSDKTFNGSTNITDVKMIAKPGNYSLKVKIGTHEGEAKDMEKTVLVHVRECEVGEHTNEDNRGCSQCLSKQYNFNPGLKWCEECAKNAECNGKALVPVDGYWHHNSHSDVMFPCLNAKACTYANRTDELAKSAEDNLASGISWDGGYPLCQKGHEGILCGSCSETVNGTYYGKSTSLDCVPCMNPIWTGLYVLSCILVLVFLAGLFVKGARAYARETLARGALLSSQSLSLMQRKRSLACLGPDTNDTDDLIRRGQNIEGNAIRISDIVRILVNFLQVSTVVTSFRMEWQGVMVNVVNALDWVSGLATGAAYTALSCALGGADRYIYGTYLAISLPAVTWLGFALHGLIAHKMGKSLFQQLRTFWFVSAMALLDVSYTGLTQKMTQVFYCTPVRLGNEERLYWAEDTSIECYKGPHAFLVIFAGAPLLIFVSLGFPIALFVKLFRRTSRLHLPVVVSRYGYFYQAYHSSYAYWNVLVQLRKGLLAVMSVLSLTFSEEFKLYFALVVLLLAVALHNNTLPYKHQKLNRMETASLYVSAFICILQCVMISPEANIKLQTVLSVLIMLLLLIFTLFMALEVLLAIRKPIHEWLKGQDEYDDHTGGVFSLLNVSFLILTSRVHSQAESWKGLLSSMATRLPSKTTQCSSAGAGSEGTNKFSEEDSTP